jgi:hypothetical protein
MLKKDNAGEKEIRKKEVKGENAERKKSSHKKTNQRGRGDFNIYLTIQG